MAQQTIARLYHSYDDARAVVHELEAAGLPHDAISLVANADAHGRSAALSDTAATSGHHEIASDPAGGGKIGAVAGTVLGGGAGLLAGIGALAIPGVGPVVAAGWLVAALTGAGIGAASGGLIGSLTSVGVNRDDAQTYADGVQRGGSLVTARIMDNEVASVEAIMDRRGAVDSRQRTHASDWVDPAQPAGTMRHPAEAGAPGTAPLTDREPLYAPDRDPARRL